MLRVPQAAIGRRRCRLGRRGTRARFSDRDGVEQLQRAGGGRGARLGVATVPNALKPLPFGFLRALRLLGTPRRETVVIGDQLFTDVLGAKLLGLRSRADRTDRRARFPAHARVALARALRL